MWELIKSFFGLNHEFKVVNHFNIGDVCLWPHPIDSCMDCIVRIDEWYRVYDNDTKEEYVTYTFTDIYSGYEYAEVKENELQLLATNEEMLETYFPYTTEKEFKEYIKSEYGY